jgi:Domain of unknown function (DUF2760)
MKKCLPYLAIALVLAIGALFGELPPQPAMIVKVLAAFLALLLTIGLFLDYGAESGAASASVKEQPRKPSLTGEAKGSAAAEVITFLARMQEKGRLIDFLMDDISSHDDRAIGAAARVVHQGCSAVMKEHLSITPVDSGTEGATISVPSGYNASLYRLTGNLSGKAPFNGTLVHKGWKVTSTKLPKVIAPESGELPPLAPAQVEV